MHLCLHVSTTVTTQEIFDLEVGSLKYEILITLLFITHLFRYSLQQVILHNGSHFKLHLKQNNQWYEYDGNAPERDKGFYIPARVGTKLLLMRISFRKQLINLKTSRIIFS